MGRHVTDITNQRFGSLIARKPLDRTPAGAVRWQCDCDCGGTHITTYQSLTRKQCTRCGACRSQNRRITAESDPLYTIHIKCPGAGHMGGAIIALDKEGNLKAFGGWSGIAIKSSNPWDYRPLSLILASMEARGLIGPRKTGERFAAWEKRNRVAASIDRFVPDEVMRGWWDRADNLGLINDYPADYRRMWHRTMYQSIGKQHTKDMPETTAMFTGGLD